MKNGLPSGWTNVTVGDIVAYTKGKKPSILRVNEGKGFVPYLDIHAIEGNGVRQYAEAQTSKLTDPDEVLVVWDGARSGWVGLGKEGAIGSTIMALDMLAGESKFLYYFLQSQFEKINSNTRGTGIPHVDPDVFWNIEVPLAPVSEQRRIVEKLGNLLTKVDASRERLEKIPVILKRFRQSVLAAASSGKLTEDWREEKTKVDELPHDWKWVRVGDLFAKGDIFDGPFGSNLKTSDYTNTGVRVVRLENIGQLSFLEEKKTYISEEKYQSLRKHTISEGDIIFASFISDEIRACVLPKLRIKSIAKADCFCLRPNDKLINRTFLSYQLVSKTSYDFLIEMVHGATRPRINTTQLKELRIRICSIAEQHEIVRRVEQLFTLADRLEKRYSKAKLQVEKLGQSILSKAFRGELIAQNPLDEPATVLLERIREARSESPQQRKTGVLSPTDRQAGVLAKIIKLHNDNPEQMATLGHVKGEKICQVVESHIGLNLGRNPFRLAAGPADYPQLQRVEHRARKQGWFFATKSDGRTEYRVGRNIDRILEKLSMDIGEKEKELDKIIRLFLPMKTKHAEVVATVYAAWNDLVLDSKQESDEAIVQEAREKWAKEKLRIPREAFFSTINWLRKHDLVPVGQGKHTRVPEKKNRKKGK